jgi:nucleoside-diphosphate-sugar epimerase
LRAQIRVFLQCAELGIDLARAKSPRRAPAHARSGMALRAWPRLDDGATFDVDDQPAIAATVRLMSPHRRRRLTLLIVGCGDVGTRVLRLVASRWRVLALTSTPAKVGPLRAHGAVPLIGDLDDPTTLGRLADVADFVLHLAPPPAEGERDPRTAALVNALARSRRVRRLVYASTSGVYGDCGGERVDETRTVRPLSDRARRRVDAESRVRWFGRWHGATVSILRVPGIYALDRPGGDPRERLQRGTPVLAADDDVHTNHIHADDLARACIAALLRAAPQRVYHASDDTDLKMGEYFDLAADLCGLARPPRIARADAARVLSPLALSFMSESRRLANARMVRELKLKLRYPTVADGLRPAAPSVPARVARGGGSNQPPKAAR